MNKETYKALKRLFWDIKKYSETIKDPAQYCRIKTDLALIRNWIDEVAKEYQD